jgi:hypothetical protein
MAQSTTGSLTGVITDPQGAIVSGATVTLTNSETRVETRTTSNDQGEFVFPQVPPGRYSLGVEATNFKKALATDLVIEVGKASRTTVVLEVGSVTEQVTITATQDIVNSSSPTLTSVINTRQVQDLPLPTRNRFIHQRSSSNLRPLNAGRHQRDGQLREDQFAVRHQRAVAKFDK